MDTDTNTQTRPLPTLNLDLLKALVAWAAEDDADVKDFLSGFKFEGEWDQAYWGKQITNGVCETAHCIAGQAVVQAGYQFDYRLDESLGGGRRSWVGDYVYPAKIDGTWDDGTSKKVADTTRRGFYTPDLAQRIIGLTDLERSHLFNGDNTLADVVFIANEIANRRGLALGIDHQGHRDTTSGFVPGQLFEGDCVTVMGDYIPDEALNVTPATTTA